MGVGLSPSPPLPPTLKLNLFYLIVLNRTCKCKNFLLYPTLPIVFLSGKVLRPNPVTFGYTFTDLSLSDLQLSSKGTHLLNTH